MRWLVAGLYVLAVSVAWAEPAVTGPLARSLNDAFAGVYEKVAPSVVVIEVQRSSGGELEGLPQGLQFFLQPQKPRPSRVETDEGSGFIISPNGYILTNNHVVENAIEDGITVTMKDGKKFKAQLVGLDKGSDIAVLKIDGENLPIADLGDSDAVKVGQFAFAIGAPFDLPYTFTVGVISAKGRNGLMPAGQSLPAAEEFLQTDASINPGNSGGPLCDIDGKVVGINTMISGMNRGLGFAVPMNLAKDVADQLIAQGRVSRPWLGISIVGIEEIVDAQQYFPNIKSGVIVQDVFRGTPAASSGLQAMDVVTKVDGVPVAKARDLQREIVSKKVGQTVKLDIARGDKTVAISVRTSEQPPTSMIQASNRRMQSYVPGQLPEPQPKVRAPYPSDGTPGLTLAPSAPDDEPGARVQSVAPGSPAETAGLLPGDIILEAANSPIRNSSDLEKILKQADLSRGIMVIVKRDGETTYGILKL